MQTGRRRQKALRRQFGSGEKRVQKPANPSRQRHLKRAAGQNPNKRKPPRQKTKQP